jgi:hypothetical protein
MNRYGTKISTKKRLLILKNHGFVEKSTIIYGIL